MITGASEDVRDILLRRFARVESTHAPTWTKAFMQRVRAQHLDSICILAEAKIRESIADGKRHSIAERGDDIFIWISTFPITMQKAKPIFFPDGYFKELDALRNYKAREWNAKDSTLLHLLFFADAGEKSFQLHMALIPATQGVDSHILPTELLSSAERKLVGLYPHAPVDESLRDPHAPVDESLRATLDAWINLGADLQPGKLFETESGFWMPKDELELFEQLIRFGKPAIPKIEAAALIAIRAQAATPDGPDNVNAFGFENAGTLCLAIGCIGGPEAFDALERLCEVASMANHGYFFERHMVKKAVRGIACLARDDARAMKALPAYGKKYRLTPMINEVLERRGVKPIIDAQAVAAEFVKGNVETLDL
jgi:hypothetical protein